MIHPLVNSLTEFTDPQIEGRIFDLQRKYFQTQNPDLRIQIANLLDVYKEELSARRAVAAQKQQDLDEDGNKGLDSLIKVS